MKKIIPLLFAAAAAALCLGCSVLPGATETSAWYRTRLKEAAAYNKTRGNRIIGSKELWTGTVQKVESVRIILKDRKCLYSPPDVLSGGYCNVPEDESFMLVTQYVNPPLKPGDRLVFVATHTLSFGLMDGTRHPHPVDGARMAKIDPETGAPIPLSYDSCTLNASMRERLAFGALVSAFFKDIPALEQALRDGSDPNAVSPMFGGRTFFTWMLAHRSTTPEHVLLLLKYGADPSKSAPDGRTPLMTAACHEKYPVTFCRLLLNAGADPNQDTGFKEGKGLVRQEALPPLFTAVRRNHLALAELLLEHGADPLLVLPLSPAVSGAPLSSPQRQMS